MDVSKFVITVAPQNLIWPQGKTYPIKAIINSNNNIATPDNQIFVIRKDLK